MTAVVRGGWGSWKSPQDIELQVTSKAVPRPGRNEVLVRVSASSVNPFENSAQSYPAGHGLGADISGVVVALGPGCGELPFSAELKVGDAI